MNNSNVLLFPAHENMTVEQALSSMGTLQPTDVLCIGFDDTGTLLVRSSKLSRADALFMLEAAKLYTLQA